MKILKNIFSQLHVYVLWLLLSTVLWGWIFSSFITDTKPEYKVVVYADAARCADRELSLRLEDPLPPGLRMVRVHPFSYAMFDRDALLKADLFVVPASEAGEYLSAFSPLTIPFPSPFGEPWKSEGVPYGVKIYDAASGRGAAGKYIGYAPEEDYYLFFGAKSVHAAAITGSGDDAALDVARRLLDLQGDALSPEVSGGMKIEVNEPDSRDDVILGMDASCVPALERSGVIYRNFDGEPQDVFRTLAESGVTHIRVRVWNHPYDAEGRGYGGGNCDMENALEIGRRSAHYGMKLIVDFHYSDFWADPGKQMAPLAWAGMPIGEKAEAAYLYTKDCLLMLKDAGVDVGMVQVGNETNGALCGETDWDGVTRIMSAGSRAVREILPDALVAVHFTNPEKAGSYDFYVQQLAERGVDYDVFASSWYPFWHGTIENLSSVLSRVAETYGKKVMIMETSYPYTEDDSDFFPNTLSGSAPPLPDYPCSVQSQSDLFRMAAETIIHDTVNGIGAVYWEGTWISVGQSSRQANSALWEQYGSGWAASFAAAYDPQDAGRYFGGCAVDNQAMFDPRGIPLESLKVFGLIRSDSRPQGAQP